MKKVPVASLEK